MHHTPINYLSIVLTAFLLNSLLILILRRISLKYNFLVSRGIPHVGGLAVGVSFILVSLSAFFIYGIFPRQAIGIIAASLLMLIFGIIDDRCELSVSAKFIVQAFAASALITLGVRTQIVYIGDALNILITLLWILGVTNAINHLDIMDGLAGGAALIASLAFSFLAILSGDVKIIVLALSLAGATLSFLLYNLPPAKIYMGNAGSHLLGFVLAAVAIIISYAPIERKIALLSPILILGLPLFDTTFLILMRMLKRKSIFRKSNDHIVLRFLKKGHSKNRTLFYMLTFGLFSALSGIILVWASNILGLVIVVSIFAVSLLLMRNMSKVIVDG